VETITNGAVKKKKKKKWLAHKQNPRDLKKKLKKSDTHFSILACGIIPARNGKVMQIPSSVPRV
jgi:hypothetical protein